MPGRTKPAAEPAEDTAMSDAPPSAQAVASSDAQMEDGTGDDGAFSGEQQQQQQQQQEEDEEEQEEEEEVEPQRVKILPGSSDTAASFEFTDEGHTLGNALRYIIMKNPDVEFCAYTIPHPAEPKMNVRIQTYGVAAVDALKKGLTDLQDVCDVVAEKFWAERQAFNSENGIER